MGISWLPVCTILLVAAVSSVPVHSGYRWITDSNGHLHLVDIIKFVDEETPAPYFDGEKDVTLNLYSQNNPTTPQRIALSDDTTYPNFNPNHPTRFLIHGWNSNSNALDRFRRAYIATGLDFNVVTVDWRGPASSDYPTSKVNTRLVGEYLAEVIKHLKEVKGLNLDDVYIIGQSLGGQIAGVAGNRLDGQAARVVGLDAASPLFQITSLENRLDPSDGKIVQGIHTNGGVQGWYDPLGDVDFFPNGGSIQPGCGLDITGACSHQRAPDYYTESINSREFVGTQCGSYSEYKQGTCADNAHEVMGEWMSPTARGNYYLYTNSKSPFGQGQIDL